MSMLNRAAQFAPFAALTGYDEALCEAQSIYEDMAEYDLEVTDEYNDI